jgi:DNA-binding LacI/PurR family transcriptional regulator
MSGGIVSPATREAVLDAAAKLGYQPNRAARALINGRTGNVGLLVPDLENPYYTEVLKGVSMHLRRTDYHLLLADSDEDTAWEREMLHTLRQSSDGLLICSPRLADADLVTLADPATTVVLNRIVDSLACVTIDPVPGIQQAVQHLAALGHRHIAYVAGPPGSWSDARRREGLAIAEELGVKVDVVQSATPTFDAGTLAGDLALATGASGIIAFNDLLAIGMLNRLLSRGVSVPADVSIIGNDDIAMASMCAPKLTTISSPKERIGQSAAATLLRLLKDRTGASSTPEHILLPAGLTVRASTGVAPQ